jgi:hypothetical protein
MFSRPQDECITIERLVLILISSLVRIILCIVIADVGFSDPYPPGYAAIEVAPISFTLIVYLDSYRTRSGWHLEKVYGARNSKIMVVFVSGSPRCQPYAVGKYGAFGY